MRKSKIKKLMLLFATVSIFLSSTLSVMALPDNTIVIGNKAFSLNALFANASALQQAMNESNNQYYYSIEGVTSGFLGLFDNKAMTAQQKKDLGNITYTDYDQQKNEFLTINYTDFDTIGTVNPKPTPKADGLTRLTAANINTTLKCDFKKGYPEKDYSANITVKEIIRGATAWQMIKNANMFNDPAPEGKEYILAKIKFDLVKSPDQYTLSEYDFKLISEMGKEYRGYSIVLPEPELYAKLYEGASHEGYVGYLCDITDNKSVINFNKDYYGNGGVWFKTY